MSWRMNRVHHLLDGERKALLQLQREAKQADVRSRCDMILLSDQRLSAPRIAKRVRFSGRTVLCYIERYEAAGLQGLLPRPRPGRPRPVTPEYEALLIEAVEKEPRSLGLPFSNWTTANLSGYLAHRTSIKITPRQVENYLKALGFRLRRPVLTVKHEQDPELVQDKKRINGLLALAYEDHILLLGDSVEVGTLPSITRC